MSFQEELNGISRDNGAYYFGVADLSSARDFIAEQGGDELNAYPYALSLGINLIDPIVDRLPHRKERFAALNYRHHAYNVINSRLDLMAQKQVLFLV